MAQIITDDFSITRGDTYKESIVLKDDSNNVVDLTGCKLYFTVKNQVTDSDASAVLQVNSSSGTSLVITDAPNGAFSFVLSAAQTAALSIGTYYYDMEIITAVPEIYTFASGKLTVKADITLANT